jgi:hypothetical protein
MFLGSSRERGRRIVRGLLPVCPGETGTSLTCIASDDKVDIVRCLARPITLLYEESTKRRARATLLKLFATNFLEDFVYL